MIPLDGGMGGEFLGDRPPETACGPTHRLFPHLNLNQQQMEAAWLA